MDSAIQIEDGKVVVEYEIIENAPLPFDQRRRKYPFKRLRVGDGFDIPDDRGVDAKGQSRAANNIRKSALAFCRAHPHRNLEFTLGAAPDKPGYLRCVRIN